MMAWMLSEETEVRLGDLRTIPEVAAAIGIDQTVVHYYLRRGDVPAYRLGKVWVVRACDVEHFRAWHSRQATDAPAGQRRPGRPARSRLVPAAA